MTSAAIATTGSLGRVPALERVRSLLGEDFQRATVTNRNDGGINVYLPVRSH